MENKFKVGDRVISNTFGTGIISHVHSNSNSYVYFDNTNNTLLMYNEYLYKLNNKVNKIKNKQSIVYKQCEFKSRQLLICICYEHNSSQVYVGYSVCNTEDVFNKELGEKIALGRALKKSLYSDKDMSMSNFLGKSKQLLEQIADKVIFDIQNEIITIKGINE